MIGWVLLMGSVAEFFRGIVKSTKVLAQKVGAFIVMVFLLGMIFGGFLITGNFSKLWFVAFGLAIVIFWNDFGEGVGYLVLLFILFFFFPDLLPTINL